MKKIIFLDKNQAPYVVNDHDVHSFVIIYLHVQNCFTFNFIFMSQEHRIRCREINVGAVSNVPGAVHLVVIITPRHHTTRHREPNTPYIRSVTSTVVSN